MVEDYILELFEEELAELEMQDDELLMVLEEPDQLPKDSFVRLNYLLDSKIDFKLQEVNEQLGINILPNQLSTFKLLMCNFWNTERMIGISIGNNLTPPNVNSDWLIFIYTKSIDRYYIYINLLTHYIRDIQMLNHKKTIEVTLE
mgnify:CR=1 FL=1